MTNVLNAIVRRTLSPVVAAMLMALPSIAQQTRDDVNAEMTAMFGGVPSFMSQVSDAALVGLWQQTKALNFADDTAIDPKTKALISLAVSAQIPCQYCVWMDTGTARAFGATDQEIAEAVAVAGLTRNWSANFYGLQVDFEQFRTELGGS